QQFATPDVIDQHVDVAVVLPDPCCQALHPVGVEMVDPYRDSGAAKTRDQLSRLFDRLRPVVVGPTQSRAASGADDRRAGLAQSRGDATPGASRRPGNDSDPTTKRVWVWRPSQVGHAL